MNPSKTIEMMEHGQPACRDNPPNVRDTLLSAIPYGTWLAETIRASGRVCRAKRPDTRLLLTSAKSISEMSCYAGAIHTGHSCITQHFHMTDDCRADGVDGVCTRLSRNAA